MEETTSLEINEDGIVEKLVLAFEKGTEPLTEAQYLVKFANKMPWDTYWPLQNRAINIVEDREQKKRAAKIKTKLQAAQKKLVDCDSAITIPVRVIDNVEAAIKSLLPEDELENFNVQLRVKSSAITYRDIAFIAAVHRLSVLDNGTKNIRYKGTSPFARIATAATSFNYRETKFDNRQIRYALTILEALEFTSEHAPGVHHYHKEEKRDNKAGEWSISHDRFWTRLFL